jgi:hypothetical protein
MLYPSPYRSSRGRIWPAVPAAKRTGCRVSVRGPRLHIQSTGCLMGHHPVPSCDRPRCPRHQPRPATRSWHPCAGDAIHHPDPGTHQHMLATRPAARARTRPGVPADHDRADGSAPRPRELPQDHARPSHHRSRRYARACAPPAPRRGLGHSSTGHQRCRPSCRAPVSSWPGPLAGADCLPEVPVDGHAEHRTSACLGISSLSSQGHTPSRAGG